MHVLILGASGRTGRLAVSAALQHGHTVTALVRDSSKTTFDSQSGLTIVQGNPRDLPSIEKAFSTQRVDAVIITLAVPREADSPFAKPVGEPYLIRDSVQNVITTMKKHGTQRLVVLSAFGAKESFGNMAWPLRALMKYSNMKFVYQDHDTVDEIVRTSGLQWSLVRPAMLNDGEELKDVREFGEAGKGVGMFDSIQRRSVAEYLVAEAEREAARCAAVVVVN